MPNTSEESAKRVAQWEIEIPLEDGEAQADVWPELRKNLKQVSDDLDRDIKITKRASHEPK